MTAALQYRIQRFIRVRTSGNVNRIWTPRRCHHALLSIFTVMLTIRYSPALTLLEGIVAADSIP